MFDFVRQAAVAALVTGTMIAGAHAQDAKVDPKADEIVKALVEHYSSLDTASAKLTLDVNIEAPAEEEGGEAETETIHGVWDFAAEKPNHFSMRIVEGEIGMTVVSDGTDLFMFSPNDLLYMKDTAADSFSELALQVAMSTNVSQAGEEGRMLLQLMSENARENLLMNVSEVQFVGDEKVGDKAAKHIKLVRGERIDLDMFIAAEGKPWILQVKPDIQKFLSAMGDPRTIDVSVVFSDWSSEKPAADVFAFTPPDDAELYDPNAKQPDPMELVDQPAPDFILDLLGADKSVKLADHNGKDIVILDFWATWCGPCVRGLPVLQEVAKEYKDKNVVLYAVDLQEEPEKVAAFVKGKSWDMNVLMDGKGRTARKFNVGPIPHRVIISKDGIIESVHIGVEQNLDEYRDALKKELDELIATGKIETAHDEHDGHDHDGHDHDGHDH